MSFLPDNSVEAKCDRPPLGWTCSRGPHADGPCAASPDRAGSIEHSHTRKELARALTWIENNAPNGVALVARALSETGK